MNRRMVKRKSFKQRQPRARARERNRPSKPDRGGWLLRERNFYLVITALAFLGLLAASYLTYLYYSKAEVSFCEAGSGCDLVRDSEYSTLLSVPVALLGLVAYVAIIVAAVGPFSERIKKTSLAVIATVGFTFSAVLTYFEAFHIRAFCPYCIASAILMTAIFALLHLRRPVMPIVAGSHAAVISATLAGVVILGSVLLPNRMFLSAEPTPPVPSTQVASPSKVSQEEFRVALAKHLQSIDAKLFGDFTCSHCSEQKSLFGDAISYIDYVECHPEGENPKPQLCESVGVRYLPTWWIKGELHIGLMSLEELARISGYEGP